MPASRLTGPSEWTVCQELIGDITVKEMLLCFWFYVSIRVPVDMDFVSDFFMFISVLIHSTCSLFLCLCVLHFAFIFPIAIMVLDHASTTNIWSW